MGGRIEAGALPGELRDRLEQLPALAGLAGEHVRITARFQDGRLHGKLRLSANRISAGRLGDALDTVEAAAVDRVRDPLETIAQQQGWDEGDTELVAEYELAGGTQKLRWIDVVWEIAVAP